MKSKALTIATALFLSVGMIFTPTISVKAAGLTQVADSGSVNYGTVSEEEKQVLAGLFDFEYYKKQNPELVEKLGDNYQALFEHFCNYGLFEGRCCSADFDPSAYAAAYDDLSDSYGTDILKYYIHYATEGKSGGRTITTLSECAKNNISVTSLADPSIIITPEVYIIATTLGTTDYQKASSDIGKAAYKAAITGKAVAVSSESSENSDNSDNDNADNNNDNNNDNNDIVIIVPDDDEEASARARAMGLEPVGTIDAEDNHITIYVIKGGEGAALYDCPWDEEEARIVDNTDNYEEPEDINENFEEYIVETVNLDLFNSYDEETEENLPGNTIEAFTWPMAFADNTDVDAGTHEKSTDRDLEDEPYDIFEDPNGDENTEYAITASIDLNDDGTLNVTVGGYDNDEDSNFGFVAEYTMENEIIDDEYLE